MLVGWGLGDGGGGTEEVLIRMRSLHFLVFVSLVAACSSDDSVYTGPTVPVTGPAPSAELAVESRVSLAHQVTEVNNFVGVTQSADG